MDYIPRSGRSPGGASMATHSSILARKIPWTEEPGGLQSMGVTKSWAQLKWLSTRVYTHTHTHTHTHAECCNQDICSFSSISGKSLDGIKWKGNCSDTSISLGKNLISVVRRRQKGERGVKGYLSTFWLSWESAGTMMEKEISSSRSQLSIFQ